MREFAETVATVTVPPVPLNTASLPVAQTTLVFQFGVVVFHVPLPPLPPPGCHVSVAERTLDGVTKRNAQTRINGRTVLTKGKAGNGTKIRGIWDDFAVSAENLSRPFRACPL